MLTFQNRMIYNINIRLIKGEMMMEILTNVLYCISVVLTVVNSSLDVYKYSKSEKTKDDKKRLKKCLGENLLVVVILSTVNFL